MDKPRTKICNFFCTPKGCAKINCDFKHEIPDN